MDCSGSKRQGGESIDGRTNLANNEVTLYGDYFNSDTRSIASILDFCNIKFQFIPVNTLEQEHKQESYLSVNKAGTVPMLVVDQYKILAGGSTFLLFLAGQFEEVGQTFFQEAYTESIWNKFNWFNFKMMPETQRLIRLIVSPKVYGGEVSGITSASIMNSRKEEVVNRIFSHKDSLLEALDNCLKKTRFIASDEITAVDVITYCEISTIMAILSKHHTDDLARKFEKFS